MLHNAMSTIIHILRFPSFITFLDVSRTDALLLAILLDNSVVYSFLVTIYENVSLFDNAINSVIIRVVVVGNIIREQC